MRQFKDPVYGYVTIPKDLSSAIIDTAEFQRLRNIRQTSYSPLYPSSLHNRFTHSIGVYFLGSLAVDAISKSSVARGIKENIEELKDTFKLACLLHDIGHAPFSHTGERFYFTPDTQKDLLFEELYSLVGDNVFTSEAKKIHSGVNTAANHEIVSVVMALKTFEDQIDNNHKSFFARCITGYAHENVSDKNCQIENCFIQMLNSSLIDVDRLDYVIRDAHNSGFQSVSIDFRRLLEGWTIYSKDNRYVLAFKALSASLKTSFTLMMRSESGYKATRRSSTRVFS